MSTEKSTWRKIYEWHEARLPIVSFIDHAVGTQYPAPRNLNYYDSKLKVLNVFRINTFEADDFPVPPDVLRTLQQRFRGLTLPSPSNSPTDGLNFASLLANSVRLRASLDEKFRKEFYTQEQFKGQPLGFFAAFVDARNPQDTTVRFTRFYFDPTIVPTQDDRAVTLAHERAHTVLHLNGHPGTGDNPFNVTPHLGDPNVKTADQALANPYCYEWLTDAQTAFEADFLELYNPEPVPVHLGGLFLTDNPLGFPDRHPIADLTFIPAFGHFVFIADGDEAAGAETD